MKFSLSAILLIFLASIFGVARVSATVTPESFTAADVFVAMPQSDLYILSKETRQDMVDYMKVDSIAKKLNTFRGKSWIERMTPDFIKVRLTDASSLQIKILETSNRKYPKIAVSIYTVGAENNTTDSTLKFFDSSMQELPMKKFFTLPDPENFYEIPKDSNVKLEDLLEIMPFYTFEYNISENNPPILSAELTMADYLTSEQQKKVLPYLKKNLLWTWNGKNFKLNK